MVAMDTLLRGCRGHGGAGSRTGNREAPPRILKRKRDAGPLEVH